MGKVQTFTNQLVPFKHLNDLFRCVICMERLKDAHLCPYCSKLCCYYCIIRWLDFKSTPCPHCREIIRISDLVKCRWLDDVIYHIETIQIEQTSILQNVKQSQNTVATQTASSSMIEEEIRKCRNDDNQSTTSVTENNKNNKDHYWMKYSCTTKMIDPDCAILGGIDTDGDIIYIGRAKHDDNLLPANIIPNKGRAYVCFDGKEYEKLDCEVLCGKIFSWRSAKKGNIPLQAVKVGYTFYGASLYIGRSFWNNCLIPGKIHPSRQCLYIPYQGDEISIKEYQVLVFTEEFSSKN